jgi:hypothetical protein
MQQQRNAKALDIESRDMLTWILKIIELAIENTPIVGKLKLAIERDYPLRPLSRSELLTPRWLGELCALLDAKFKGGAYDKPYNLDQIRDWIESYEHAFIVVVRKKIFTWPLNAEHIAATVKILPLREDFVNSSEFDPYQIKGHQLVEDENEAKAVWVGDLVSTDDHLTFLFLALRYKLEDLRAPVYCRTEITQLRRILFERYGARVMSPTGTNADGMTILVLDPGKSRSLSRSLTRRASRRGRGFSDIPVRT